MYCEDQFVDQAACRRRADSPDGYGSVLGDLLQNLSNDLVGE
jgi:hypothetical protein